MARAVGFGVTIPYQFRGDFHVLKRVAEECDGLGVDSLWMPDHVQLVAGPYLETWTTLSALASATERVRLGTIVLCNSFRYPSLVAKMAASLDVISGGRLELGLGAGWMREEYEAYGYEFPSAKERIAQLREAVRVIRRMWSREAASYRGRNYVVKEAVRSPKPVQKPHSPILITST